MKITQNAILALSFLMGIWVLSSFIGVMVNTGNVEFWTTSLVWSLLSSVVVMPSLVIVHHAAHRAAQRALDPSEFEARPVSKDQTDFIDEEDREDAWPVSNVSSKEKKS